MHTIFSRQKKEKMTHYEKFMRCVFKGELSIQTVGIYLFEFMSDEFKHEKYGYGKESNFGVTHPVLYPNDLIFSTSLTQSTTNYTKFIQNEEIFAAIIANF